MTNSDFKKNQSTGPSLKHSDNNRVRQVHKPVTRRKRFMRQTVHTIHIKTVSQLSIPRRFI